MAIGDTIASVQSDGTYSYRTVSALTPVANERWAVKFVTPNSGTLGGKEVAIEAKQTTIATLQSLRAAATTDTEKESYLEQITIAQSDVALLQDESYDLMLDCVTLAMSIGSMTAEIDGLYQDMIDAEESFSTLMGDMLQDGYYSDQTYAPGQEEALYNDAVALMGVLSHPQLTYDLREKDIVNVDGYSDEIFTMNMGVRFYNATLGINDYGFVSQIGEYLDRPGTREVEIQTDELNIQSKSFSSFLGRITDAAQIVKDQQTIYDRAKALSKDGTFGTDKLNGVIDILQNRLLSTKSNWSTDDNGNIIFVSADESNAMMLCGTGFMVANGKTQSGDWNWRTFGSGEGFTADLITAGILRAGIITILGSDQFYWTGDNLYVIDTTDDDNQIRIGRYDGVHLGIGYTNDGGLTWQNAIGFDGVHLSASDQTILNTAGMGGRNYIRNSKSLTGAVIVQ